MLASEIAYLDIETDGSRTLGDVLAAYDKIYPEGYTPANKYEASQIETIQTIKSMIKEQNLYSANSWVIKDSCNDNSGTGMYGCMIETEPGEAVIAFRGSESYDVEQFVKDWVTADAGLLNSTVTAQQQRAEEYTRMLYAKYGDQYDSFSLTGHSLGGNLAEHCMITAPDGFAKKIDRAVNLDGPGFSDEYIARHANQIRKNGGKIDHYQWSLVGTLLFAIPGSNYRHVSAKDADGKGLGKYTGRHSMKNLRFKDGSVYDTKELDPISKITGPASKVGDGLPIWANPLKFIIIPTQILTALLNLAFYLTSEAELIVREVGKTMQEAMQKFGEAAANLFREVFLAGVASGEFSADTQALRQIASELGQASAALQRASGRVHDLTRAIQYESPNAAWYKNLLWIEAERISSDGKKAGKISEAVNFAASTYDRVDAQVGESFALV